MVSEIKLSVKLSEQDIKIINILILESRNNAQKEILDSLRFAWESECPATIEQAIESLLLNN